ncbi:hypothetical protein Ade02nite_10790 [Paractinoplanes deccanensis]|uniref:Thymidylate synthase/dCMP hydroxymethylase domain-containing protein n=1 Tax=Paractinoplanes deccanensis TaxID=113561 RepID=A0ABQ3XXG7_9ACTN|nr:thymidylate synthase [Actinoplanes deccanensis]GID72438.1 hypothetical protein Ade02nite_10790 [Actinoplanes deccanensis]
MATFSDLAQAMTAVAGDLLEADRVAGVSDARSVGSSYGTAVRPFREILAYTFSLEDPRRVLIDRPARPIHVPYLLANILWTVAGSDAVDEIGYWNPRAMNFSDDGACIRSAPGPRLFGAVEQFAMARRRLTSDPSTRRAIMLLVDPADLTADTKDIPCIASLQFFLRGGRLSAIGTMRSQSAIMVMPYDIPLLTSLQCLMARELGVEVGTYTHHCNSLHFYEEELAVTESVAAGDLTNVTMPAICSLPGLRQLASRMTEMRAVPIATIRSWAHEAERDRSHSFSSVVQRILLGHVLDTAGDRELAAVLLAGAGAVGGLSGPATRAGRS